MLRGVKLWAMKPGSLGGRSGNGGATRLVLYCNLLIVAACAPSEEWSVASIRGPRCALVHCDAQDSRGCWASTPGITLHLDQGLESLGQPEGSVAILPWTLHDDPQVCDEGQGCEGKARCLRGRCWSSPRSATELRRWFRGQAPLPGALPGWQVQLQTPSQLRLQRGQAPQLDLAPVRGRGEVKDRRSSAGLSSERGALWAIYVSANWVTPLGHPVGVSLEPLAFLSIQDVAKGMGSRKPLRWDLRRGPVQIPPDAPLTRHWNSASEKDLGPR